MRARRHWQFWVGLAAFVAALIARHTQAEEFALWGHLQKGPYPVGFRSLWQLDVSRTYSMTLEGKLLYGAGKAPRPILLNIWYPAIASHEEPMRHRGYLSIQSQDPRLAAFSRELARYERGVLTEEVMHKSEDKLTPAEKQLLDQLLDSPTACRRDAEAASGRYPLVMYHSGFGSSFEDNSVLCEFLASHGFVVLGSAFQEPSGKSFNVDGQVTSGRDLDFLIEFASHLPDVDWQHIGLVGHSGGAHASLMYRSQPSSPIDALVSLDTTEDYYSLADPRWERLTSTVTKNRKNVTGPLLIVANPHAFFPLCDLLDSSQRYYLTFRDPDHEEFISQGCLSAELRLKPGFGDGGGRGGQAADKKAKDQTRVVAVRRAYESLCVYVLRFFEAQLKGSKLAQHFLATQYRETPLGGSAPHVVLVPAGVSGPPPYRDADPVSPTPRQLRPYLRENSVAKTIGLLKQVRNNDPDSPVLHEIFAFALVNDLLDQGKNAEAIAFCGFFEEAKLGVVKNFVSHGDLYRRIGIKDRAVNYFKKALILDAGNANAAQKLKALETPAK